MPDQSSAATEHAILQEITAPLRALPDDALATIEADFPTSLRGYDRVAVDEYVRRTRRLVAELQATRSPEAAVRRALERVGEQISGILQRAHETAEQITAQSRSEAEDRLEHARREAVQIMQSAEDRVRELDAETDRIWVERQRIVADAEDLAGRLTDLSKVAAERFPSDDEEDDAVPVAADDEELLVGTPVEAGAPEAVSDEEEVSDEEDEAAVDGPFDEDYEPQEPPELEFDRMHSDEVERTVAFTPLERSEDETTVLDEQDDAPGTAEAGGDGAGVSDEEPTEPQGGATDEESTRVIRPASQAANRRLGR